MAFRSFRATVMLITIAAATVPVIAISWFTTDRISRIVEGNAERELRLEAERASTGLRDQISATLFRAMALGRDSDIERATSSVLFVERAETLFEHFLDDSKLSSAAVLINPDGRAVAWAPLQPDAQTFTMLLPTIRRFFADHEHANPGAHLFIPPGPGGVPGYLTLLVPVTGLVNHTSGVLAVFLHVQRLEGVVRSLLPVGAVGALELEGAPQTEPKPGIVRASSALEIPGGVRFSVGVSEARSFRFGVVRSTVIGLVLANTCTVLILAAIAYLIARMVVRPLAALETHVNHYAEGRYDLPLPKARFSEFSAVLATLSSLGQRITEQIRKSAEQERIRGEIERSNLETELRALRTQMQPHFLFNILNNIATMTESAPGRAAAMLTRLSDLYRLILDVSKGPVAPLNTELMIVEHYLALQEMRFGDRLKYRLEAPENADDIQVPCMLIQTLVENAVKHGISKSREGGRIEVAIRKIAGGDRYECRIRNTGAPFVRSGKGTGIENTIKRLDLLYGPVHGFHIDAEPEQTSVIFTFMGIHSGGARS